MPEVIGPREGDIVLLGPDNEPKIFPGGIIASTTWYRHAGKPVATCSLQEEWEQVTTALLKS